MRLQNLRWGLMEVYWMECLHLSILLTRWLARMWKGFHLVDGVDWTKTTSTKWVAAFSLVVERGDKDVHILYSLSGEKRDTREQGNSCLSLSKEEIKRGGKEMFVCSLGPLSRERRGEPGNSCVWTPSIVRGDRREQGKAKPAAAKLFAEADDATAISSPGNHRDANPTLDKQSSNGRLFVIWLVSERCCNF